MRKFMFVLAAASVLSACGAQASDVVDSAAVDTSVAPAAVPAEAPAPVADSLTMVPAAPVAQDSAAHAPGHQ